MLSLFGAEGVTFPGGYCSATCQAHIECGASGECPVAESIKALGALANAIPAGVLPSHCYERCASAADCRTDQGYRCDTIVAALGASLPQVGGFDLGSFLSGPIRDSKYCLPPAPPPPDGGSGDGGAGDGGSGDGGAGGGDGGAGDGGSADGGGDGGPSDAGSDAGSDV
jgi:hypothetical protein